MGWYRNCGSGIIWSRIINPMLFIAGEYHYGFEKCDYASQTDTHFSKNVVATSNRRSQLVLFGYLLTFTHQRSYFECVSSHNL
jgi:hypothetical protein